MVGDRTHTLNLAVQGLRIRKLFPTSELVVRSNELIWRHAITPSVLSATYSVQLLYVRDDHPNVNVLNPKLALYPGELRLPHVYDTEKQWLCLYRRRAGEWKSSMHLADTVIPWICEWLLHYELWLATGTWRGGGIHFMAEWKKIQDQDETEEDKATPR